MAANFFPVVASNVYTKVNSNIWVYRIQFFLCSSCCVCVSLAFCVSVVVGTGNGKCDTRTSSMSSEWRSAASFADIQMPFICVCAMMMVDVRFIEIFMLARDHAAVLVFACETLDTQNGIRAKDRRSRTNRRHCFLRTFFVLPRVWNFDSAICSNAMDITRKWKSYFAFSFVCIMYGYIFAITSHSGTEAIIYLLNLFVCNTFLKFTGLLRVRRSKSQRRWKCQ